MDTAELLDAETAIQLESDYLDPPDSDPSEVEVNTSLFGKINIRAAVKSHLKLMKELVASTKIRTLQVLVR